MERPQGHNTARANGVSSLERRAADFVRQAHTPYADAVSADEWSSKWTDQVENGTFPASLDP